MGETSSNLLLDVRDLRVTLKTDDGPAQVLDNVSLRIRRGEILGVVGESGCGKSTLVKAILGILPISAVVERGQILFDGANLLTLDQRTLTTQFRGRRIGFIPQDPFLALNPTFRVGSQMMEIMRWHAPDFDASPGRRHGGDLAARAGRGRQSKRRNRERLLEMLRAVQIPSPESALRRYPHQFSGGQRQRMIIAAALACQPQLLIADEPTSALDVTTQREILLLLKRLAEELEFSVLFVTHDFGVVAQLCSTVTVIYAGQTVETGEVRAVLDTPRHPYTQALIACHPDHASKLEGISGVVPSPLDPPSGCRFNPRCPSARPVCLEAQPLENLHTGGHAVKCVLYESGSRISADGLADG